MHNKQTLKHLLSGDNHSLHLPRNLCAADIATFFIIDTESKATKWHITLLSHIKESVYMQHINSTLSSDKFFANR